jgi:hypothetical protein
MMELLESLQAGGGGIPEQTLDAVVRVSMQHQVIIEVSCMQHQVI